MLHMLGDIFIENSMSAFPPPASRVKQDFDLWEALTGSDAREQMQWCVEQGTCEPEQGCSRVTICRSF